MTADSLQRFALPVLRLGIAFVLIWFGVQQYLDTPFWTGFVPDWATALSGLSEETIVLMNGSAEIVFGLFILLGIFTRLSALVMALHLVIIAIDLGNNSVAIRDWGLALATFAIFLHGPDWLSLEVRERKSRQNAAPEQSAPDVL